MNKITFLEDESSSYVPRTKTNAKADATIAVAVHFNSAGEKLTKRSVVGAGKLYISIHANEFRHFQNWRTKDIVAAFNEKNVKTLNIAGNSLHTLGAAWTQAECDEIAYNMLSAITTHPDLKHPIELVRSGGQTGFDEAGSKAAAKLGIPSLVYCPKNWRFRTQQGYEVYNEQEFKQRFE